MTKLGYQVTGKTSAVEALATVIQSPAAFDLVITDLTMPEKEGIETIMEIKKLHSAIKILAISGGGEISPAFYLKCADAPGADASLQKPFTRGTLLQIINTFVTRINGGMR